MLGHGFQPLDTSECYYLVMMFDIYRRTINGWQSFLTELSNDSQSVLVSSVMAELVVDQSLVLNAGNVSPFTAGKTTFTPSFSQSRVKNNHSSELLFRSCKYRPCYPDDGFATVHTHLEIVSPSSKLGGCMKYLYFYSVLPCVSQNGLTASKNSLVPNATKVEFHLLVFTLPKYLDI